MPIIRFGIDLAKSSFAVCGVDTYGKIVLRKTLKREKLLEFFANRPPAMVAIEAGSGAHHWARELRALGHDARIIDPRLVAPYRQQGHSGERLQRCRGHLRGGWPPSNAFHAGQKPRSSRLFSSCTDCVRPA